MTHIFTCSFILAAEVNGLGRQQVFRIFLFIFSAEFREEMSNGKKSWNLLAAGPRQDTRGYVVPAR